MHHELKTAERAGFLPIEWIGLDRFNRALHLRGRYGGKPEVSFTDLTSMVGVEERDVQDVFIGDAHFEHVGTGFRRQP